MNFIESLKGAMKSLVGNKMRAFLTMLGIIIGISSVITMTAIGKGGQENIVGDLKKSGYGNFTIAADKEDERFRWKYLLDDEIINKLKQSGYFTAVSPQISQMVFVKIKNRNEMVNMTAITPAYQDIDGVEIIAGRAITPFEYEEGEKVIMVDHLTAKDLFGGSREALGQKIDLIKGRKGSRITYKIVGVYPNPLEQMVKVMGGRRIPRYARIPQKTYEKVYETKGSGYDKIIIKSKNPEQLSEDLARAKFLMEEITETVDLYEISTVSNAAASFDSILTTLNIFVTFVAGISLFVGGIGVMNIMLVSVVERTKEIGIRKALGARNKDILVQFLMESVILTGLGGGIGVIFGITLALVVGTVVNIPPIFTMSSIVISLGISTLIGIVFGVAPARKAAQLNPIDALRAE